MKKIRKILVVLLAAIMLMPVSLLTACYGKKVDKYNFFYSLATLPSLFFGLDAATMENAESYIWNSRAATFLPTLPAGMKFLGTQGTANSTVFKSKVAELYEKNPKASFNFFTEEIHSGYFFDIMVYSGIPLDKITFYVLSDGTASYGSCLNKVKTEADYTARVAEITETMDKFYAKGNDLIPPNAAIQYGANDVCSYFSFALLSLNDYRKPLLNADKTLQKSNDGIVLRETAKAGLKVEYRVHYPTDIKNSLTDESVKTTVQGFINNGSFAEFNPEAKFKALTASQKTTFKKMFIDTAYFDNLIAKAGTKTIVMWLGASPSADGTGTNLKSKMQHISTTVSAAISKQVTVWYKGHPSYTNSPSTEETITNAGMAALPTTIPAEVIILSYPQILVGSASGASSTYLTATDKRVIFTGSDITTGAAMSHVVYADNAIKNFAFPA